MVMLADYNIAHYKYRGRGHTGSGERWGIALSAEPRRLGPAVLGSAGGLACFPTGP